MSGILVIGDVLADNLIYVRRFPQRGADEKIEKSARYLGGSAANTAAACAALGVPTEFCGIVGDDADGRAAKQALALAGVGTSCLQTRGRTGFTVTVIDETGERTMMSMRGASGGSYELDSNLEQCLASADMLLVSGYMLTDETQGAFVTALMRLANDTGKTVALDPCPTVVNVKKELLDEALSSCGILLANEREADYIASVSPSRFDAVSVVVTKLGSRGAAASSERGYYESPALQVEAVDTTGAGDAFNAGFLAAAFRGLEIRECLDEGNRSAANAVTRTGATSTELQ